MQDKTLIAQLVASELTGSWELHANGTVERRWEDADGLHALYCRTDQELRAAMANDLDAWYAAPMNETEPGATTGLVRQVRAQLQQRGG